MDGRRSDRRAGARAPLGDRPRAPASSTRSSWRIVCAPTCEALGLPTRPSVRFSPTFGPFACRGCTRRRDRGSWPAFPRPAVVAPRPAGGVERLALDAPGLASGRPRTAPSRASSSSGSFEPDRTVLEVGLGRSRYVSGVRHVTPEPRPRRPACSPAEGPGRRSAWRRSFRSPRRPRQGSSRSPSGTR